MLFLKYMHLALYLWLAIVLSGCTHAKNIKDTEELKQISAIGNSSVVFGRIQWIEAGDEKRIGKGIFRMSLTPHLVRLEDKTRTVTEVGENGFFVWTLPSGTFLMNKIAYRDPWSGNYLFVPKVAFTVPENGKTYYLGTLKAEFSPKRDVIGGLSGSVRFSTFDSGETEIAAFQEHFAVKHEKIVKSLMVHDSRLPQTFETTAEFDLALKIINAVLYGLSP